MVVVIDIRLPIISLCQIKINNSAEMNQQANNHAMSEADQNPETFTMSPRWGWLAYERGGDAHCFTY